MSHDNVVKITTTDQKWIGKWDTKYTGEWVDYAMHLVCLVTFLTLTISLLISLMDCLYSSPHCFYSELFKIILWYAIELIHQGAKWGRRSTVVRAISVSCTRI